MSDTETNPIEIEIKEIKEKKPKKKRELSEEDKERLRIQLAKGRATALKNRQKKALAKKIDREEEEKALDAKIAKKVLNKNPLQDEMTDLKEELKTLRSNKGDPEEIAKLKEELSVIKDVIKKMVTHQMSQHEAQKQVKQEQVKEEADIATPKEPQQTEPPKPKVKKVLGRKQQNIFGL